MSGRYGHMIFVGIKGAVVALDRVSGTEIWRRPLKRGGFINAVLDGDDLIAAVRGQVFCLDPDTGEVRWFNGLPGMGYGLATIATANGSSFPALAEQAYRDQAAASAAGAGSSGAAAG